MKTLLISAFAFISLLLIQCGPATEDRVRMHEIAKRVSDSIGYSVDSQLAITALPQGAPVTAVQDTTKK